MISQPLLNLRVNYKVQAEKKGGIPQIIETSLLLVQSIATTKHKVIQETNQTIPFGYTTPDEARLVCLDQIQRYLVAYSMGMNMYCNIWHKSLYPNKPSVEFYSTPQAEQVFKTLFLNNGLANVVGNLSWLELETSLGVFLANSLLTLIHFAIDNLLTNLCRRFEKEDKFNERTPFSAKLEKLLKQIPDPNKNIQQCFNTFTHARNCLHNNGIHRGENEQGIIQGKLIPFTKGEMLKLHSWHYINLLKEVMQHLETILLSPVLTSQSFIKDQGATFATG